MTKFFPKILITFLIGFYLLLFSFYLFTYAQNNSIYETKSKRNPFMPLVTSDGKLISLEKQETKADLLVEGIVFDKYGRSYAIVNGSVVEVGDTVVGYRVLKIEQGKVTFIKDGQTRVLEIKKEGESEKSKAL